jgi:hypothetical protein
MALGWLTLLKHVPWSDVIANAPAVADGAKKLWNAAARRPSASSGADPVATGSPASDADPLATLREEVARLEAAMLASSELINALAGQNAELIKTVEAHRVRLAWLSVVVAIVGVVAGVAVAALLALTA